jgi:hypothetical protein
LFGDPAVVDEEVQTGVVGRFRVALRVCPSGSRRGLEQLGEGKRLEHELRPAAFVHDPDVAVVDPGEARVAGASAFVKEPVVGLGPGPAVVETDLDRLMRPGGLRMGVGQEQDVRRDGFPGKSTRRKLALQLGSIKVLRLVGCACQVRPRSGVTNTARNRSCSFRMSSMIEPSPSIAAWHSLPLL